MRRILTVTAVLGTLALAGTAVASNGGALVTSEQSCSPFAFGTVCTTVETTTKQTATPSGNLIYVTNGTVERRLTFVFGGSYTATSALHLVVVQKAGETHVNSEWLKETSSYRSATYALDCVGGSSLHYANGSVQFADSGYDCTTP